MGKDNLDIIIKENDNIYAIGELMDIMGLYVRTNFYNNIHNYIETKKIDDHGLTGGYHHIMMYLCDVDHPVSVSHLAKRLMLNNASRAIGKLEDMGMIERHFGKEDRRVVEIQASEYGKKIMDEYYRQYNEAAREFMSEVFTDEQREELKDTLYKLIGILKQMPSKIKDADKINIEMRNGMVDLGEELNNIK